MHSFRVLNHPYSVSCFWCWNILSVCLWRSRIFFIVIFGESNQKPLLWQKWNTPLFLVLFFHVSDERVTFVMTEAYLSFIYTVQGIYLFIHFVVIFSVWEYWSTERSVFIKVCRVQIMQSHVPHDISPPNNTSVSHSCHIKQADGRMLVSREMCYSTWFSLVILFAQITNLTNFSQHWLESNP